MPRTPTVFNSTPYQAHEVAASPGVTRTYDDDLVPAVELRATSGGMSWVTVLTPAAARRAADMLLEAADAAETEED